MAKRSDTYYFDIFAECGQIAAEAATMLRDILQNYDPTLIEQQQTAMHEVEHRADMKKHDMLEQLVRSFMTPIERDEIVELSHTIDNVIDEIEDVVINLRISNVAVLRKDSLEFAEILIRCCEAVAALLDEFRNFKKSNTIRQLLVDINHLEEEGDKLYIAAMSRLHRDGSDALTVIVWRKIYQTFESVCDSCEHVADIVESILISNI